MKKKIYLFLMLFGSFSTYLMAQSNVSGIVKDVDTKETLIGVSVVVKGTTSGTITDMDGKFSLPVAQGKTLVFSFIGYESQEVIVKNSNYTINLKSASQKLNEVVVIGYGTSKAKDLTAPITVVKSDDLSKRTSSPMDALQGSVAGVQVSTTGQPGAIPIVRIRGNGSLNNESPLYIVDGMFFTDISFLNSSDIEEMSILKDASAAAIYGVRAANGVVIITTKTGKLNTPTKVTYSGYVGFQTPVHQLQMANGAQYAAYELAKGTASDSAHVLLSVKKFGGTGTSPTTSTDWYNQILKQQALTHNHSLDITGGGDKVTYNLGLNYLYQDGIMKAKNDYQRFNIHAQTDFQAYNWLKMGYNVLLSNYTQYNPNLTAFANAYSTSPLYPVYDATNTNAFPTDYTSSTSIGYGNGYYANPVATANYYYDQVVGFQVLPTVYADIQLIKNKLTFKSQYSQKYLSTNELKYLPAYYVDSYQASPNQLSQLTSTKNYYQSFIVDNTLLYKDANNQHHWSAMIGQSSREEWWKQLWGQASNVPGPNEEYLYLDNGNSGGRTLGDNGTDYRGLSFFGRATYDYASKYLLTATFRADGSSKYQQKWGYFPSVGAGWIVSQESFMANQHVFDYLKARASWGKLGNDGVPANNGFSSMTINNGVFNSTGTSNGAYLPGYTNLNFFSYLKWEVVNELDGGVDFSMLQQRLNGSLDYYSRKTTDLVFSRPQPNGVANLLGNYGAMTNQGLEITLNWKDKIGDLGYSVGGNVSTLKNTVNNLNGLAYLMGGYSQFPTISEVGKPVNSFYGYQVIGVYQTQAEINADPIAKANGLVPGDLKYKDVNGDGVLDNNDKVLLGNYLPNVTYGFNVGLNYKKFELNIALQGQAGNKILNMNRAYRYLYGEENGDAQLITHLWTGPGTTNSYPSASGTTRGWNQLASSFFVEDGSYLRVQTIQLAYSFKITRLANAPEMRISFTADRPFIFTKYSGFSPDISSYFMSSASGNGYDFQNYPTTATYSLGWRITF